MHYTDSPLETQLRPAELFKMLTDHLASWNIYVHKASKTFDVVIIDHGCTTPISTHKTAIDAFKAALEAVPDIMFDIMQIDGKAE